jgi:hypothetical protein
LQGISLGEEEEWKREDWTLAWQPTELEIIGQDKWPLKGEEEPLQMMVTTSPEGHSKEWFSGTPATQSTSKEVIFEGNVGSKEANPGLCWSFTFTKQAGPLALQGELPNDTNNGRDKIDSYTISPELVSFLGLSIVDERVRVSEREIRRGKTRSDGSSIDNWEDAEAERELELLANNSSWLSGMERVSNEEDKAAEYGR